ncbi:hypothetical protein [Streptomyces griseoluteus]|uniref:hypothetical protein n=1 Tax=Streptomyces griseoluteus TaxID=29306 RepID=UPI0016795D9F|nr:hypothetical protein [Streptomyces griseoluteus]GHF33708.1 hypothetical protein GCM10017776_60270 [Streptomyces griseoluteus]
MIVGRAARCAPGRCVPAFFSPSTLVQACRPCPRRAPGLTATVEAKEAVALASRLRDGLGVRDLAAEIPTDWIA